MQNILPKEPKLLGWWLLAGFLAAVFLVAVVETIAPGAVIPQPWEWANWF